ncbi:MAG: hypothetical protein Q9227_001732 [Pyrenula ochraceoflavens]
MSSPTLARELYAFPAGTFIENLALHPRTSHLLLTTFAGPDIYALDPSSSTPAPTPVATCPGSTGLTGISAIAPDIYAVTGGIHIGFGFEEGSMRVYVVDFSSSFSDASSESAASPYAAKAVVKEIAQVPASRCLNGLAALPAPYSHVVLSGDSIAGKMYRIDTRSGAVDVAFSGDFLEPLGAESKAVPLGVNGVKMWGDGSEKWWCYFTNSARGTVCRVRIDPAQQGSRVEGEEVEILARLPGEGVVKAGFGGWTAHDDLAVDREGNAYVTVHGNAVVRVKTNGEQEVVAGGGESTVLKEPTSAVMAGDGKSIFVSTGGSMVEGESYGGQVVEVKI